MRGGDGGMEKNGLKKTCNYILNINKNESKHTHLEGLNFGII